MVYFNKLLERKLEPRGAKYGDLLLLRLGREY